MAPDLNSLPPSRSPDHSAFPSRVLGNNAEPFPHQSPSRRSSSISLAAAATINAGIQQQDSRRSSISSNRGRRSPQVGRSERRRSNVAMSLNLNDPTLPGPGELVVGDHRSPVGHPFRTVSPHTISPTMATGDPHHQRAPSLGELHQELEQEQEAQVNRLLQMIRQQQAQLQQMQQAAGYTPSTSTAAVDDSTPTSERSFSFPPVPATLPVSVTNPRPRSPIPHSSFDLSRQSSRRSRTSSRTNSPSVRPLSAGLHGHSDEWLLPGSGGRDESAFYQAETQNLTRENQMLRMRIRELERQLNEANAQPPTVPATPSNLTVPPATAQSQASDEDKSED